jgi:hypothetical protein
MTISHRPITADDRRFVVSAWSASYKDSHTAGMISTHRWAEVMHAEIERVLDQPGTQTLVAFEAKDPTFVYGFISGDPDASTPTVYYCYTKAAYRRQGIARGMFSALGVDPTSRFLYACRTAVVSRLGGKLPAARFDPSTARYSKEQR